MPVKNQKSKTEIGKVKILGVPVLRITKKIFLQILKDKIGRGEKLQVATVNPEFLVEAQKDKEFFNILQKTLNVPDGVGVLWAGYFWQKTKQKRGLVGRCKYFFWFVASLVLVPFWKKVFKVLPEKISGSDVFWDILALAEKMGWRIFLLGGAKGVAKLTAEKIKIRYPRLRIVGADSGGKILSLKTPRVCQKIKCAAPHILFVAFGSPKQEKWIAYNLKNLSKPLVAIGVGGTFDFVAGKAKRAPSLIRTLGLEWFWRLVLEPQKRFFRIFKAVIVFPWLVFRERY